MDSWTIGLGLLGLGVIAAPFLMDRRVAPLQRMIITSPYGAHRDRGPHGGVDLRAAIGTPIYAPEGGKASRQDGGPRGGNIVKLVAKGGRVHVFAHLSKWNVGIGDRVRAGQLIGWTGESGNVSGPHLHWQIKVNGKLIDPIEWLEGPHG